MPKKRTNKLSLGAKTLKSFEERGISSKDIQRFFNSKDYSSKVRDRFLKFVGVPKNINSKNGKPKPTQQIINAFTAQLGTEIGKKLGITVKTGRGRQKLTLQERIKQEWSA